MVLGGFFAFLPVVTELPFGTDEYFATGIGFFNRITELVPILSVVVEVFLLYIGFRITVIIIRFFAGSRSPVHN